MIHFSPCSPPPDNKRTTIWPSLRSAKNVKKQQEVSDLNRDYWWHKESGPDSRNDLARDRLRYDPVWDRPIAFHKRRSSDQENTNSYSLLPVESWHKTFTGKFEIEITRSWLNEKRQTDDIYSWRYDGMCGDVIYECRYETVMASSVHAHSVAHNTTRFGHAVFDRYVYVINVIENIQTIDTRQTMFQWMFLGSSQILTMAILLIKWPFVVMKFLIQHRST